MNKKIQTEATTLDQLFDREPLTWTPEERKLIIAGFRSQRAAWNLEEKTAKTENRKPKRVTAKKTQLVADLGLDSLLKDL